ncbi:MAG TPA: alpha/beta hydrolase [Asanoa sp.]|nr:alpha/beta hydrolase [Asanoa sp.]
MEKRGIHVVRTGPPTAQTLVLVHGSAGSTASWDTVVPALQDLDVVRVDLLGHGRSAKPADGYGIAEQARRLGAVLDDLGVLRAILVGHSTGGSVVTSLAEQRRDLVEAIALIDTGPRLDASFTADGPVTRLLANPVLGPLLWAVRTDGMIRAAARSAFTRDVPVPAQMIADAKGMTRRSVTATFAEAAAFLTERPVPDRLAGLGLPLLVLFGSADRRWQPSSVQDYRRVPGARIEILDGIGHTPMVEDPETTTKLLRGFIHDVTAPGFGSR